MIRLLIKSVLLMFIFCVTACKDDLPEPQDMLEVRESILFSSNQSRREIAIKTNVPEWSFALDNPSDSWCKMSQKKSGKANYLFVNVEDNLGSKPRETVIKIKAGGLIKNIAVSQLGSDECIVLSFKSKSIESDRSILEIEVISNAEFDIEPSVKWINHRKTATYSLEKNTLSFDIDENLDQDDRTGSVSFKTKSGSIQENLTVTQKGAVIVLEKEDVTLMPVSRGEASEAQPGRGIENSFDGDGNTLYHSLWDGTTFPVTLTYFFDNASRIDYVTIHSRPSGNMNGNFREFDVFVGTDEGEELLESYDFMGEGGNRSVNIGVENPRYVKFVINSGEGDFVSCAEMRFYQNNSKPSNGFDLFTDKSCSELKEGVTRQQIEEIDHKLLRNIALKLYNNDYNKDYIVQKYSPIIAPRLVEAELKLSQGFSRYENITGVFLRKGTNVVLVGETKGYNVALLLPNFMRKPADGEPSNWGLHKKVVSLKEGMNVFDIDYDCNAYIRYFTERPENAPEITVHFPLGYVNGYFDYLKHDNDDWKNILENSVSPIIDLKGKYIHIAFTAERFKMFNQDKAVELLKNYDTYIEDIYTFMGLKKYNRMPANRLFARVNFHYYFFRDADGMAFKGDGTLNNFVNLNPSKPDAFWTFCHETGHVMQMTPQLTWGGMTEVSNNLYAMNTTIKHGNVSRLKKGNHYQSARNGIVNDNAIQSYLEHKKPLDRLVPLWQLHLYFQRYGGNREFYADVMEALRKRPHAGTGNNAIKNQLEFVKVACDVGKTDLIEFFDKWKFFYVGDLFVNDYANYNYKITQKMVDDVKNYVASKKYPKPVVDLITIED